MLKKLKWDIASINYDDFTLKGGIIKEVNFNAIKVKKKVFKTIFGKSTNTIEKWGLFVYIQTDDGYNYKAVYDMGTTSSIDYFNNVPTIIKNNKGKKNNKLNPLLVIPLLLNICNVDNFNELVGSKVKVIEKAPHLNEKGFAICSSKTCNYLLPKYFEIQKSGIDDSTISENNKGKKKKKVKFLNEDNKWKIGYTGEDNEELIIPKTITEDDIDYELVGINEGAFMSCTNLSLVTIPEGVTFIGEGAFSDCTSLSSVIIPNSVTEIIEGAFDDCDNLTTINIDNVVDAIPGAPWGANNATINWLREPVDFTVTHINRTKIGFIKTAEELVIPSTFIDEDGRNCKVVTIDEWAFFDCSALTSVTIPDSVKSISHSAFSYCSSLTNITIPESINSIEGNTFLNCESLSTITIPNSVTNINEYAFYKCDNLTTINVDNTVDSIPGAPWGATNATVNWLKAPIDFIDFIVTNNNRDMIGYTDTTEVLDIPATFTGDDGVNYKVVSIGDSAFWGCINLTSITIPDTVTTIDKYAFENCHSLTSITIPESVTSIGDWAFANCNLLATIDIPESVTIIGSCAFWYCKSLTSITIPNNITAIPDGAFSTCIKLTSITIPDGVTSIESGTFQQCESLTNIDIPNSVTSIRNVAFWGCKSLTSIDIPNSVTNIGTNAFHGCIALSSITIPGSVTTISEGAFSDCTSLSTINIVNTIDSISGAPWSANNATITWLKVKNDDLLQKGCDNIKEFLDNIIKEKDGCIFKDYQDEFKNTITSLIKSEFGYPGNPNNKPYGLDIINSVLKSDLKLDNIKYTISIVYKTKTTPRHWKIHKTEESE